MVKHLNVIAVALLIFLGSCQSARSDSKIADRPETVGPAAGGGYIVPTQQLIRPAGRSVEYHGRPVDLVLSRDGKTVYVKSNTQLLAIDADTWQIRQELKSAKGGASMHGIALAADGKSLWVTLTGSTIAEAKVGADGALTWGKRIEIPATGPRKDCYPCGIAMMADGMHAAVCLSVSNTVAIVDLAAARVDRTIDVSVAPYDIALSGDGKTAYVSNWGGRRATKDDKTQESAGTPVVVDDRGVACTGTVGVIDLAAGKQVAEIAVGLHPSDLELTRDGKTLFVANANSDTVSVIDTSSRSTTATINVRPDEELPFGSMSNALALSGDEKTLFVANGGNNALAVVDLAARKVAGFVPAGWYPGTVVVHDRDLFIANIKGVGSRDPKDAGKLNSHSYWGSVTKVATPADAATLAKYTEQVRTDALVPQTLRAWEKAQADAKPLPVPKHVGEPSTIEHVVYIIKENRTYDQVLGDIAKGNGDAKLCTFGREISPNHHALAEQFALLDNYYCNGICSADGHAWVTEGLAVDYLEKSFGGWSRSYPFPGDDSLAFSATGFIWDNVLLHGLSFRNYGEFSVTRKTGEAATWGEIYEDWKTGGGTTKVPLSNGIAIDTLRKYSCPDSPGWNLRVTDQLRADAFLKELAQAERSDQWPNLMTLYLPQDHTSGTNPSVPTPAAMVADNDLALGRVVEAVSHSKFWPKTCIFVIEDDPQNGFDHVDGHRSICLVASPYTKRGAVVSRFYNQTSVLHTMELMLGLPPMNQLDAMAPTMEDAFTSKADLTPYKHVPNNIPLDQMNPPKSALRGLMLELAEQSERLPLEEPDRADENTLNRIVWHSVKGPDAPYPAAFAGAHGKGLKQLHLKLDGSVRDNDDD
jgi:YVTN family beta-propeller protein